MSKPNGDRIGGIGRRSNGQSQKRADHKGDLLFLRRALAHHGLLDPSRRVFVDRQPVPGRREQDGSACGPQRDRRLETLHVNDALHGDHVRLVDLDLLHQLLMNREQTGWDRELRDVANDTEVETSDLTIGLFQNREARAAERGIDGEDFFGWSHGQQDPLAGLREMRPATSLLSCALHGRAKNARTFPLLRTVPWKRAPGVIGIGFIARRAAGNERKQNKDEKTILRQLDR